MNHKQNLVNLLSNFPNVSTARGRQTFIDTVGLTKLANDISTEGTTRDVFNDLIDVIVKTDGPNGLYNFIDNIIASGWVGGINDLKKLKTQLQNLDSRQWHEDFGYVVDYQVDKTIIDACPYRGLLAFQEEHAPYFLVGKNLSKDC